MDPRDQTIQQLQQALDRRTTIGVALGILMERFNLTQEQAWQALTRESSWQNRKIHDLSSHLAETGHWQSSMTGP